MRDRFFALIGIMAFFLTSGPVAASELPLFGGPGDATFEDHCPANQYLIGLAGGAGAWIDRIQIVCSPILPDGTHGARYYGPSRGGSGGGEIELECPPDAYVNGALISLLGSEHLRLRQVDLGCGSTQSNQETNVAFAGNVYAAYPQIEQRCVNGELASGFHGHYGKDVNALELYCDVRSSDGAPVSASTPKPIRMTGRPVSAPLACPQGFVWREASASDHVCVTVAQRTTAAQQNDMAGERVSKTDRTYGPNTCAPSYVWREAYSGDVVCVTPAERDDAANENTNAPSHVPGS